MANKMFAAIAIFFIVASLFVALQVEVAKADPFFMWTPVDPPPGSIPPTITILSPQNNTIYSPTVFMSFNISKPQLGNCSSEIIEVDYSVDNGVGVGKNVEVFTIWQHNPGGGMSASSSSGIPEFNTNFSFGYFPPGTHSLVVSAQGVVFGPKGMEIFYMNSTSTTIFTVDTQLTPSPSSVLTSTPTSSVNPSNGSQILVYNYWLDPIAQVVLVSVVVIVAVALIIAVYFKVKKKHV